MDTLKLGLTTYSRKNHGLNAHLEPRKYFLAYEQVEKVVDELQARLEIFERAERIESNSFEERCSEASHYTWLDDQLGTAISLLKEVMDVSGHHLGRRLQDEIQSFLTKQNVGIESREDR